MPDTLWTNGLKGIVVAGGGPQLLSLVVRHLNGAAYLKRVSKVCWGDINRIKSCSDTAALEEPCIELVLDIVGSLLNQCSKIFFTENEKQDCKKLKTCVDADLMDSLLRGLRSTNTALKDSILQILTWLAARGAFSMSAPQRSKLPLCQLRKLH